MRKTFCGIVCEFGNLKISNPDQMKAFVKDHPKSRILLTLEIEDEKGSVYAKSYFKNVICEAFKSIFIKHYGEHANYNIITARLLSWSPFNIDEDGNERDLDSLSKEELSKFIDHCKMIASKEFDVYIYE